MGDRADMAWEKAAACDARASATPDGKLKAMFLKLRQSWIQIGNAAQFDKDVKTNANPFGQSDR